MESTFKPFSGLFVWSGSDLAADDTWVIALSNSEIREIDGALTAAKSGGATWQTVGRENFPLERVTHTLSSAAGELENGRGVVKLTGLPVTKYTEDDLRLIWMGLGRYLGTPVNQDCGGQMMRDIRDEAHALGERYGRLTNPADGAEFLSSKARTYSNGELRYHTDRTDVVGLLSVRTSKSGGLSKIASSAAVHNTILERRPDLLELLYQPIYRSRLGEEQGGEAMVYPLPVFGVRDGKLTSHYSRTYIEAAQLLPDTPRMRDEQWQALDLLAAVSDELCCPMTLEPGDMQLLNNHVVYHARAAFKDDPGSGRQRLLFRLWLCMPRNRALPEDHAVLWGSVEADSLRGGIQVEDCRTVRI